MKGTVMKISKTLTVMLFVIMLISTVSFAQDAIPSGTARFEAMGYNPFIKDASIDMNRNPAWTTEYRNYVFGDIGRDEDGSQYRLTEQFGGVNFGVNKNISLGLVLNKNEDRISEFGNRYGIGAPSFPMKVLFGIKSGNNLSIGIAPYFGTWSQDSTLTGASSTRSSMVFGGTVGILNKMNNGWIEGSVDVKTNSYKYETTTGGTTTTFDSQGGLNLSAFVRSFITINKSMNVSLVPYASFSMFNWNTNITPTPAGFTSEDFKITDIRGGLGVNMPITERGLLAGGLSVGYHNWKYTSGFENNYTVFTFPQFNVGMEWALLDWLNGRIGYSRALVSSKNEVTVTGVVNSATLTTSSNPDQTITVGVGFEFGRFSLDGTVGERLFKNGLYILTGKQNDMFGVISASYNFAR